MNPSDLYDLAEDLYPMPRSLTGYWVRRTLLVLAGELDGLQRYTVPSGSRVYDWTVPPEWSVTEAYLDGPDGRVCSWEDNPLHLVFYSDRTDERMGLDELREHLYTAPGAIPYVSNYYDAGWGFCLSEERMSRLPDGEYRAYVNTRHDPHGHLDYADLTVPGTTDDEVLFSTYTCHPNLANDNVSGLVVQTALARWIASEPRRYTYRFVFCPETIGALVYMAHNNRLAHLQEKVVAGFVLNFLGDDRSYSMVASRTGDTYADRVGASVVRSAGGVRYGWMQRGSDERQYGSPGADLPVVRLSRSEHHRFPEYHTSADDLSVISGEAMADSLEMLKRCVRILEGNGRFECTVVGDAQLGERGLYPTVGHGERDKSYQHVLSYCDGAHDTLDIATQTGMAPEKVIDAVQTLQSHGLVEAA